MTKVRTTKDNKTQPWTETHYSVFKADEVMASRSQRVSHRLASQEDKPV